MNTNTPKKRGLGRGLDALFQDSGVQTNAGGAPVENSSTPTGKPVKLPVGDLTPGEYQPRRHFDEAALDQLAESISTHGILQPILVRPMGEGRYEIIAGERRWRAAQRARLHDVPVIVQDLSDDVALEIALIENLQREDLSPLEEAEGLQRLVDEFDYTQEQLATKLGKSRSHVTNTLRLLKLPEKVKPYVQDGRISAGHARALLSCKEPLLLAAKVMQDGLSVRQTEKLALTFGTDQKAGSKNTSPAVNEPVKKTVDTLVLEKELSVKLGMRCIVNPSADGSGTLTIQYKTLDQFDDLLNKLTD